MFANRLRPIITSLLLCALAVGTSSVSAQVEAKRGKRYLLHRNHGPWMIMVASLSDVAPERRKKDGLSAWQAADELVYELRKLGLPAYCFLQGEKKDTVEAHVKDQKNSRTYIAQHEAIAVLACNFNSPEDEDAQRILKYLKSKFEPKVLTAKYGVRMARTPGRPTPLSRAHMTVNPLMKLEDINKHKTIKDLKKYNANMEYSLLKNRGKYSLKIATFDGAKLVQTGGGRVTKSGQLWMQNNDGSGLDEAYTKAWELAEALRSAGKLGYERSYDAYVLHERYRSIVTVGSFDSPGDPRIAVLAREFKAKPRNHNGRVVEVAEILSIPKVVKPGRQPDKLWYFDTMPKLIEVPR